MKSILGTVAVGLVVWILAQVFRGPTATEMFNERAVLERREGSVCLAVSVSDGRTGWSTYLTYVLEQGKGEVFPSKAACEENYLRTAKASPRR